MVLCLLSSLSIYLVADFLYLLQSSTIFDLSFPIPLIDNELPQTLLLFIVSLFVVDIIRLRK